MRKLARFNARSSRGFTLIEVLIAILVLAFGLLGFALLQTMNVRFVQSANYRTQATNLAYDLIDQMRSNRYLVTQYTTATFAAGSVTPAGACAYPTGAAVPVAQNIARWQCQVAKALGDKAAATVTYVNGVATVTISWGDQRWDKDNPDTITSFALRTEI
ncbi:MULTISPECIES: type IV pilus modification protein PilV [Xanthomonas]|uniref:Type IV pilus assembly protein PilV n=2 Tax=Xanthomonas TaxID=338 RepID=A0A7Z7IXK0_XANCH|nr:MULTISPECIES: type IV pilus modification protein PilV [Xanthomonas]ATS39487.1 type IV pilus modification protein PilV [Xanthomonas citri pv. phaseoli var. fuscans]ATS41707.1 type IV pilus modification protein PilV [Xanthomonas citri pv. phaseoli var. fuscans]ATS47489.1 type IV pilus modification protein PilV [Xanthomonas citri pv. phaseoli var. fuscans]ATS86131.1 type IV pilus modification protein PilV [Xanthomonas citri pv. phaseoli var. fuscans]QWN21122.1 type IV pilus modification protei